MSINHSTSKESLQTIPEMKLEMKKNPWETDLARENKTSEMKK